jgi:hypothetical protein
MKNGFLKGFSFQHSLRASARSENAVCSAFCCWSIKSNGSWKAKFLNRIHHAHLVNGLSGLLRFIDCSRQFVKRPKTLEHSKSTRKKSIALRGKRFSCDGRHGADHYLHLISESLISPDGMYYKSPLNSNHNHTVLWYVK